MADEKESLSTTVERLNRETAMRGFVEYPKMKYHADGRQATVNSDEEESKLGEEWFPNPQAALDEKQRRDDAASKAFVDKVNAEAAKSGKGK